MFEVHDREKDSEKKRILIENTSEGAEKISVVF